MQVYIFFYCFYCLSFALSLYYIETKHPQSKRFRVLNAQRIRQDAKLEEGGTLRASNGEQCDRVTLVTEDMPRVRQSGGGRSARQR